MKASRTPRMGSNIPVWLIAMALILASAGAAVGTVLAGKVTGEMPVTVSQALLVGTPRNPASADWSNANVPQSVKENWGAEIKADRFIGTHSDDQTAFQAAAEIDTGDKYIILVPIKNASKQDLVAQLTLIYPEGFSVEVVSADQIEGASLTVDSNNATVASNTGRTKNMTRTGLNTWKFIVDADADKEDPAESNKTAKDCIAIVVAASDTIAPGFYTIKGKIQQISY